MAPQAWFRGPICGVDNCRSRRYRTSDGLTICQLGHVADGNIEVNNEEDEAGGPITRRLNTVHVDSQGSYMSQSRVYSQGISTNEKTKVYGKEAFEVYLQCLQILFKQQFRIVTELFFGGTAEDSDLVYIVKTNWLKLLDHTIKQYESRHYPLFDDDDNDGAGDRTTSANDPVELTQKVRTKHKAPTLNELLALLYLSILQLRYKPVYIPDLIENIKLNTIPYARSLHLIPKSIVDKLTMPYQVLLQPTQLPMDGELESSILIVAGIIYPGESMEVEMNYYYPFAFKMLSETLLLPSSPDLFTTFVQLSTLIPVSPKIVFNLTNDNEPASAKYFPEVQICAFLVFVVKVGFIFNVSSAKKINPKQWLHYLKEFELTNEYSYITSYDEELLNWSDSKIDKYCHWIYDHVIPKKNNTSEGYHDKLTTMDKRLFQIFNFDTALPPATKRQKYDSKQHHNAPEVSRKETMLAMVEPNSKVKHPRITPGLITIIESKIVKKFCDVLGIQEHLLMTSYLQLESDIKSNVLERKRPTKSI